MVDIVFLIHLICSVFMTGVIWVIQRVQYPSFKFISKDEFNSFYNFHAFHITWIVAPIMVLELFTAAFLVYENYYSQYFIKFVIVLLMNIILWISTFFLSVPCHNELARGRSDRVLKKLVNTNWIRTIFWTAKTIFLVVIIV